MCCVPPDMYVRVLPSVRKTTYADIHHDAIISIKAVTLVSQAVITEVDFLMFWRLEV